MEFGQNKRAGYNDEDDGLHHHGHGRLSSRLLYRHSVLSMESRDCWKQFHRLRDLDSESSGPNLWDLHFRGTDVWLRDHLYFIPFGDDDWRHRTLEQYGLHLPGGQAARFTLGPEDPVGGSGLKLISSTNSGAPVCGYRRSPSPRFWTGHTLRSPWTERRGRCLGRRQ